MDMGRAPASVTPPAQTEAKAAPPAKPLAKRLLRRRTVLLAAVVFVLAQQYLWPVVARAADDSGVTSAGWFVWLKGALFAALKDGLQQFWTWLLGTLLTFADTVLGLIVDHLPQDWRIDLTPLVYWLQVANAWFPLDWTLGILALYYGFLLIIVLYRVVKSWIPTVSG
jgi:hypothetical protein